MHRIERVRIELAQVRAATLAARLRQRLQRNPGDALLLRLLAAVASTGSTPSLPLPGLPPAGGPDRGP
jgi:hypothetical protein